MQARNRPPCPSRGTNHCTLGDHSSCPIIEESP